MGTFSIWHWLIVLVVVLVLFGGRGKISQLMGDMARGITAFKKGLKEDDAEKGEQPKALNAEAAQAPAPAQATSGVEEKKDKTA